MSNSTISGIMNVIKSKFSSMTFWQRIEGDIAVMCADLPNPTTTEKKLDFINRLENIKGFLLREEVKNQDLEFLDEEINLHKSTEMMGIYSDIDNDIDPAIISAYARISNGTEGVVSIAQPFNYKQLIKLSNGVFRETGFAKFYISTEKTIYGKITQEFYEGHPQEIPIATIVETNKRDKDLGEGIRSVKIFGQNIDKSKFKVIKEIDMPFYFYRFLAEDKSDMMLVSSTKCDIGDYIVTGVNIKCNDYKALTDSTRLMTKLPFLFAQKIRSRIIRFKNHEEFKTRLEQLDVNKENLFDYPFTVTKENKTWELVHPTWYKWMMWSWLTHEAKGMFNKYPMHILQIGPKQSGKSLMLNSLHARSKETRSIFSGSSSTLKHLIPSFKYNPARLGYLSESNRFSFCDEFLRCLIGTRTTKEGSQREEGVAMMNDLLEHQKREAGSGVSKCSVNMTSRIIAVSNPVRGMNNVDSLIHGFDESFLSRWLIYYQTDEHVQMVRKSNDSELKLFDYKVAINDWISILDYLQTFSAKYDLKRIEKIHGEIPKILSENLARHYDARHKHHIECLLDGIIKTRCLMEKDMTFKANEEDYKMLKEVWINVIRSWLNISQIKNININERIFYIQENAQYLYWKIFNEKNIISKNKCREFALAGDMNDGEFHEAFSILVNMELIIESNGAVRPHCIEESEDEHQQKMFTGG